jgi:hypothetical protein
MHGIKVLMAKNYIGNLSEEARKGTQEKAEQGIWPTKTPLGYRGCQQGLRPCTIPLLRFRRRFWLARKHRKGCASRRAIWKGWCTSGLRCFSRPVPTSVGVQLAEKAAALGHWAQHVERTVNGVPPGEKIVSIKGALADRRQIAG